MEVELFIPCFIDQVYPDTAFNVVKILEAAGAKVFYNTNQTCCGQMAFNSGYWDEAKALGEKLIKELNTGRYVVGPSASCIGFIKNYYPDLFVNTVLHNEFRQLQKKTFEFTDFLVNVAKVVNFKTEFNHKVVYHSACATLREYGLKDEPYTLLKNVKGIKLLTLKDADVCCGFGGTFSVKHEPIATAMAQQKVENALDTGAEYIVSTEASCLMHLEGYIKKHKLPIKTIHIADLLASGW